MTLSALKSGGLGFLINRKCDDCGHSKPPKGGQPYRRGTMARWRCLECKVAAEAKKAAKT